MASLRDILMQTYIEHGALTEEILVAEAKPKSAPLHHRFEWNNTIAGHKYRLAQAAELIREVKIEFTPPNASERKYVRAFSSLRHTADRDGYAPTEEVVQDEMTAAIMLRELEREMAGLKARYGHLKEFAEIVRAAAA